MHAVLKYTIYWHITESVMTCCGWSIISGAIPLGKCIRSRLGDKMSGIKYFICISNGFSYDRWRTGWQSFKHITLPFLGTHTMTDDLKQERTTGRERKKFKRLLWAASSDGDAAGSGCFTGVDMLEKTLCVILFNDQSASLNVFGRPLRESGVLTLKMGRKLMYLIVEQDGDIGCAPGLTYKV